MYNPFVLDILESHVLCTFQELICHNAGLRVMKKLGSRGAYRLDLVLFKEHYQGTRAKEELSPRGSNVRVIFYITV